MAEQMEMNRQAAMLDNQRMETLRRNESAKARIDLEEQMAASHAKAMYEAQEQADQDKNMVADIMRKIDTEDFQEYSLKQKKVNDTVDAIKGYQIQRQQMLEEEARKLQDEEDQIMKYAQAKGAREAHIKASQDAKKAAEEARFKQIEADMRAKREEEEEFNQLRDLLWAEETENRLAEAEKRKQARLDATKLEMKKANRMQKQLKIELQRKLKEEDDVRNMQLQHKYEEDRRLDLEAQKRRESHRNKFQKQIASDVKLKKDMYDQEMVAEANARLKVQEEEEYSARVIEAARMRLLKQHASALGGFLPKGVLSQPGDLELLAQFDANGDGTLDKKEMAAAQQAFMKFDADKNGTLDENEGAAAMNALRRGGGNGFA